jgi:hypothetical protein
MTGPLLKLRTRSSELIAPAWEYVARKASESLSDKLKEICSELLMNSLVDIEWRRNRAFVVNRGFYIDLSVE